MREMRSERGRQPRFGGGGGARGGVWAAEEVDGERERGYGTALGTTKLAVSSSSAALLATELALECLKSRMLSKEEEELCPFSGVGE